MTKLAPRHRLPRTSIVGREEFILEQCQGKRVIHFGCANWPFAKEMFEAGELLHQDIDKVSTELAGIDVSQGGVDVLEGKGVKNLFVADIAAPTGAEQLAVIYSKLGWKPELIVLGETLEHIDSPGAMIRSCASHMPEDCVLLITVPNAFNIKGLLHVVLGYEKVHSDHVAYYSYANMMQLLSRCGLVPVDVLCYKDIGRHIGKTVNPIERTLDALLWPLLKTRPFLSSGLVFCCRRQAMSSK